MRKSILTLVLLAAFQIFSFAQKIASNVSIEENLSFVEKTVDEKSDITGTFANTGEWNVFVDDAKIEINAEPVKKIHDADMQSLIRKGFSFAKKSKNKYACYRYRIVAEKDGSQTMFLYECDF